MSAGGRRADRDAAIDPAVDAAAELVERQVLERTLIGWLQRQSTPDLTPATLAVFGEAFRAATDRRQRKTRGAFYTPWPIVQYLVRAVDSALQALPGQPPGLAEAVDPDSSLRIVDPAAGTGIFFSACLEAIAQQLPASSWNLAALTDNWRAFELSPATAWLAECGLAIQLRQLCEKRELSHSLALRPDGFPDARLSPFQGRLVRCENPLASPSSMEDLVASARKLVIVGNPPYANFGRLNRTPWILQLLADYKLGLHERKLNLNDDLIKFIRWGQHWIDVVGEGVLALVTANTFLDGLTHRRMRQCLCETFDEIQIVDLHGSCHKRDPRRANGGDENVFGIRSGVALCVFTRHRRRQRTIVRYQSKHGSAADKLAWLAKLRCRTTANDGPVGNQTETGDPGVGDLGPASLVWSPSGPEWRLIRRSPTAEERDSEYVSLVPLDRLFPRFISGIQTKNDRLLVDVDRGTLATRMRQALAPAAGSLPAALSRKLKHDPPQFDSQRLHPMQCGPWDIRWVYYDPRLLGRPRYGLMRHMLQPNRGLVFMRQSSTPTYDHFLVVGELISDRMFYNAHGTPYLAPLYLHDPAGETAHPAVNLEPRIVDRWAAALGLVFLGPGAGDLERSFGADDVLACLYACVHADEYRRRFHDQLGRGFPRVPLLDNPSQFARLASLGHDLVALHLQMAHGAHSVTDLDLASLSSPQHVTRLSEDAAAREWTVGGYAVIARWMKARAAKLDHPAVRSQLQCLVQIGRQTEELRKQIDHALRSAWPLSSIDIDDLSAGDPSPACSQDGAGSRRR